MSDLQSNLRRPRLTGTMAFGLGLTLLVAVVGYFIGPGSFEAASEGETETPVETETVTPTETETELATEATTTPTAVETESSEATATTTDPGSGSITFEIQEVRCHQTYLRGRVGIQSPFVRASVVTASNLGNTLATADVPVNADGSFKVVMDYTGQPAGTRLVVAVGEWDGSQFLHPATLFGADCTVGQPSSGIQPTPTSSPSPNPSPTLQTETRTEAWTLTSTHISSDPCSGAATGVVTVPVTLVFDQAHNLLSLDWYSRVWVFAISSSGVYSGSAVVEDSTLENITDELTLTFSSPDTFDGEMRRVVTIYTTTGNQVCQAFYTWHGTRN